MFLLVLVSCWVVLITFIIVNHNDEYSGVHGVSVINQASFLTDCINTILTRYQGNQMHVMLVGHSMGGVISSSVFLNPKYRHGTVKSIIAMGSPLHHSAVSLDWRLEHFYRAIHKLWNVAEAPLLGDVTMRTILFGAHDKMVSSELGFVNSQHVTWQWIGSTAGMWSYPSHNPYGTCKNAIGAGIRAILSQFSPNTGELLDKRARLNSPESFTELLECKSIIKESKLSQPLKLNSPESLFGRVIEVSNSQLERFHLELLSDAALPDCLVISSVPTIMAKLETIPYYTGKSLWYLGIDSMKDGLRTVRIDARNCTGKIGLIHLGDSAITRRPLWATLRTYKSTKVSFPPSSHLHRRVEVKLPSSDYLYRVHLNCKPVTLVVRAENAKTGETLWFHNQSEMLIRMHRNPHHANHFRTDQIDIWMSSECATTPLDVSLSIDLLATAGLWLRRYLWGILGLGFIAAMNSLLNYKAVKCLQRDVFAIFLMILFVKSFFPKSISNDLLISPDLGTIETLLVFSSMWFFAISVFHIVQWMFSRIILFQDPKQNLRAALQSIMYPMAVLTPLAYSMITILLVMLIMMAGRQENTVLAKNYFILLCMVNLFTFLQLGVWPKDLYHGHWSLRDYTPWISVLSALAADLLAYGRITGAQMLALPRWAARTLSCTLSFIILAWSHSHLYILSYSLSFLSALLLMNYAFTLDVSKK